MSQGACYVVKGGALGIRQGGATHLAGLWHYMWGRGQKGYNASCLALAGFQSLPPQPTRKPGPRKLGPSDADSQVGEFVYILGPPGSLQRTLL